MGFNKLIQSSLLGYSGNEFENKISIILKYYYKTQNKIFSNPSSLGGDDSNDGWCPEDKTFFQVYAPERKDKSKESLENAVKEKFKNDFNRLFKKVKIGTWNVNTKEQMEIKSFIFIVCHKENPVKNPFLFFNQIKEELEKENEKSVNEINFNIYGMDGIFEYLDAIECFEDNKILYKKMLKDLGLYNEYLELDAATKDYVAYMKIAKEISNIAYLSLQNNTNFSQKKLNEEDYSRIDLNQKIKINKLDNKLKNKIEDQVKMMPIIKKAESELNSTNPETFNYVKNIIISLYKEILVENEKRRNNLTSSSFYNTVFYSLLNKIYEFGKEIAAFEAKNEERSLNQSVEIHKNILENLIIYVFQNCDIFIK